MRIPPPYRAGSLCGLLDRRGVCGAVIAVVSVPELVGGRVELQDAFEFKFAIDALLRARDPRKHPNQQLRAVMTSRHTAHP